MSQSEIVIVMFNLMGAFIGLLLMQSKYKGYTVPERLCVALLICSLTLSACIHILDNRDSGQTTELIVSGAILLRMISSALWRFNKCRKCPVSVLGVVLALMITGCATNSNFATAKVPDGHGGTKTVGVKVYSQQADIIGDIETTIGKDGSFHQTVKTPATKNVAIMRVAVVNAKGAIMTDNAGNAVFNEIPMVAQIRPSNGTQALFFGLNTAFRGFGSMVGTAGASIASMFIAGGVVSPATYRP